MDKNIKIGLIGYGYWGKILYKTLLKLGYKNVIICDTNGIINETSSGALLPTPFDKKHL